MKKFNTYNLKTHAILFLFFSAFLCFTNNAEAYLLNSNNITIVDIICSESTSCQQAIQNGDDSNNEGIGLTLPDDDSDYTGNLDTDDYEFPFATLKNETLLDSYSNNNFIILDDLYDSNLFSCLTTGYSKEYLFSNIPYETNAQVEKFVKYFTSPRGRKFFTRWLERSTAFEPMIRAELNKEGMPEDLIYLAMIESGFNARAYSRASAVGVWQFMRGTGRMFGLKDDYWIDERRDPVKSTEAAVKFLKLLYTRYDSWYLAMAAYNAGEGKINRAIRRYHTKDFWKLTTRKRRYLKKETKQYVPKFLAARIIAKNPEAYGFTNLNYQEPIVFDSVNIDFATDLRLVATEAGVTTKKIKNLNPELRNWFTPPNKKEYTLKVPFGTAKKVQAKIDSIPKKDRLKLHVHKIRRGETLSGIADRYRTNIRAIKYLNSMGRGSFIREGKTLIIPVRATKISASYSPIKNSYSSSKRRSVPKNGLYTVRRGDTLWSISRKFGLSMNKVLRINNINKKHIIKPGQKIKLTEFKKNKNLS